MPWAGIDDGFFHHHKSRAVGLEGRELFLASICYCNNPAQLNDGCFVAEDVPVIAALAQVEPSIADRLYQQEMWHPEGTDCAKCRAVDQIMPVPAGHISIHEFLARNRSRASILAEREANAERQRKHRASRRDSNRESQAPPSPSPTSDLSNRRPSDSRNGAVPSTDDDEISTVPAATWDLYATAMLAKQPAGTVKNPAPWKRTTARNARVEHGETAARWHATFDVDPYQLAAWLVDGRPSPHAQRREPA